MQPPLNS